MLVLPGCPAGSSSPPPLPTASCDARHPLCTAGLPGPGAGGGTKRLPRERRRIKAKRGRPLAAKVARQAAAKAARHARKKARVAAGAAQRLLRGRCWRGA